MGATAIAVRPSDENASEFNRFPSVYSVELTSYEENFSNGMRLPKKSNNNNIEEIHRVIASTAPSVWLLLHMNVRFDGNRKCCNAQPINKSRTELEHRENGNAVAHSAVNGDKAM